LLYVLHPKAHDEYVRKYD